MQTHEGDSHRAAHTPRATMGESADVDVAGKTGAPGRYTRRMSPAQLLYVQRTAGNAATTRLIARQRSASPRGAGGPRGRLLQRLVVGQGLLVADKTVARPVAGTAPGRQPRAAQPPPVRTGRIVQRLIAVNTAGTPHT